MLLLQQRITQWLSRQPRGATFSEITSIVVSLRRHSANHRIVSNGNNLRDLRETKYQFTSVNGAEWGNTYSVVGIIMLF